MELSENRSSSSCLRFNNAALHNNTSEVMSICVSDPDAQSCPPSDREHGEAAGVADPAGIEVENSDCEAVEETNEGRKSRPGAEICTG